MKKLYLILAITISCSFALLTLNSYSQTPNWQWANSAGGIKVEEGRSVTTDLSGNVYVVGYFWSSSITFGSITLNKIDSDDMYIVKYDPNGNALWAKSAGGSHY